jgi:crossover junction endodeoxyribonuclease RuvC
MPEHRILGIDPGLGGALALLTSGGELTVRDMPCFEIERGGKNKRQADTRALVDLIRRLRPTYCVIERVGAMPGQGVTSMFAFGRVAGQIDGIIAALEIPVSYVSPQVWRKTLQVPAGKDGSRLRASELMPRYAEFWRLKKDDGRAEAALIALWGLLHRPGMGSITAVPVPPLREFGQAVGQ